MTTPTQRPFDPTRPLRRKAGFRGALCCGLLLMAGCSVMRESTVAPTPEKETTSSVPTPPTLPGKNHVRRSQYVFYSDIPLQKSSSLFDELETLRDQIARELQLPTSNTIVQVFIFDSKEKYEQYMHARYPELPERRAFFIVQEHNRGGSPDLLVYTFWGDHLRQDLRHELTHAVLRSVLKDVPLWLDEGLAEYFELPPEKDGTNAQHLEYLRKPTFDPDLARLEKISQSQNVLKERSEYRESWAWVHLMLRTTPEAKQVLLGYLQSLRSANMPGPLLAKLREVYPDLNGALYDHINNIPSPRAARATSEK
jgi:hypothetical protein